MKKGITVTVTGLNNSGKSRISYIVKESLRVHGFNVEFDPSMDFDNEAHFNRVMRRNLDEAVEAISENTIVKVKEVQLDRGSM